MPEMKLETSAHETMEATLRQSMEGRKEEKAKSYLTKHAVTEEKEPSDFSLHVKNAPIQEVLRSLAELTGKNIVFGGTVTGSVTADLDQGPIIEQDVERVNHDFTVDQLRELGQDVERNVLARAVKWHLEDRIIVDGNKTVVFQ